MFKAGKPLPLIFRIAFLYFNAISILIQVAIATQCGIFKKKQVTPCFGGDERRFLQGLNVAVYCAGRDRLHLHIPDDGDYVVCD